MGTSGPAPTLEARAVFDLGVVIGENIEVVIGEEIPPHAAYVTVCRDRGLRVAVSPRVEAPVLAVLHPEVTKIVVTALEERGLDARWATSAQRERI